jgi:hypothetical protein
LERNLQSGKKSKCSRVIIIGPVPQNGIYGKDRHVERKKKIGGRSGGRATCSLPALLKALLHQWAPLHQNGPTHKNTSHILPTSVKEYNRENKGISRRSSAPLATPGVYKSARSNILMIQFPSWNS